MVKAGGPVELVDLRLQLLVELDLSLLLSLEILELVASTVKIGTFALDLIFHDGRFSAFPLQDLLSVNNLLVELLNFCLHLVDTLSVFILHRVKVLDLLGQLLLALLENFSLGGAAPLGV